MNNKQLFPHLPRARTMPSVLVILLLKIKMTLKPQYELTPNPCLAHKAMKAFKYYRACLRSCSQSTAGLHCGTGFNYVQVQGLLGRRQLMALLKASLFLPGIPASPYSRGIKPGTEKDKTFV